MSPGFVLMSASLALAVLLTVLAGRAPGRDRPFGRRYAIAAFVSLVLVCGGVAAMLLEHFFNWPQWLTVSVALPLGIVLFAILIALGR